MATEERIRELYLLRFASGISLVEVDVDPAAVVPQEVVDVAVVKEERMVVLPVVIMKVNRVALELTKEDLAEVDLVTVALVDHHVVGVEAIAEEVVEVVIKMLLHEPLRWIVKMISQLFLRKVSMVYSPCTGMCVWSSLQINID